MTIKVFVPCDSVALALGADKIAHFIVEEAKKRYLDIVVVRNGSHGLFFLETLVEVERDGERYAFGPIKLDDVLSLFAEDFLHSDHHPRALGKTQDIKWLKDQTRLTFQRCGIIDPLSFADYKAHDGLKGLLKALTMERQNIIECVIQSGLRGRGGAGFPTGIKWQTVANTKSDQKYIVCNSDEGDSGSFADRLLMEGDPFVMIEGMIIAGIAAGANKGYIYIRSEYPHAIATMQKAILIAYQEKMLGAHILGSTYHFDLEVRKGAGAYVCGEETALLESLEGKRGLVRAKPPLPAHNGLFNKPTIINNAISLCTIAVILDKGAAYYRDFGVGRSRGTIPIQIAGNVKYGGLYETAFGLTLGEIVDTIGGGTKTGRPVKAVQVGGPLGAYFPREYFDTQFDYEAFAARDGLIGHAGLVVFDDSIDMMEQARFAFEFCAAESCGKCTPCRIGAVRGVEVIDRLKAGIKPQLQLELLEDLGQTMQLGSLCALGGFTPYPVLSALRHFRQDFEVH